MSAMNEDASDTVAVAVQETQAQTADALPELELREFRQEDSHDVKEFCLNNLMQRTRLSNQFVYKSPIWLGVYLSAIAWATNMVEPWRHGDWGRWAFLCCAISAMFLVGVDYFTYHYYEQQTKSAHSQDEFLQNPSTFIGSKKGKCWIAHYNNGLVGCIVVQTQVAGKKATPSAEISHWYVRARYREKGLGGDLLREALASLKQSQCTELLVHTSTINKQANKTLAKTGFSKVKATPNENVYWRMLRIKSNIWSINPQKIVSQE